MPSPNTAMEDVDAYSDSGSTISLASCGSTRDDFSPRPPRAGSAKSKSVKGRHSKVSNTTRSPYASSQQLQTQRIESTKPTARNMWMTAMKNGTGALSTNNTGINTWAGTRPAHANKKRPGSRTRNFSDVVDLTDGKSKSFSKSAVMSYSEPQTTMGGPALKPAEDYYDEIIDLKKIINLLKEENNKVNTKLHRVEQENVMKDRHIEDLLNSRKQPEDLRRTLTDKRADSSSIVTSLKQKLHAVERTVKEKETELNKIKRDLKTTDIEELKIQSEIYYQEIQRLQLALLQMQQDRMQELYADDDHMSGHMDKRPMNVSEQKLAKDIEILKSENKSLKKELISAVENQSSSENKKSLNVDYADMTRGQLLHTIHELEMRVEEAESKTSSLLKEKGEQEGKKNLKKKSKDRKSSTSSMQSTLDDREAELQDENEKQRQIIEKLKEDRTHYRLVADELRKELKTKESELEELQNQLSSSTSGTGGGNAAVTRKPSLVSSASQYSPRKESITAKERDEMMDREFKDFQEKHAAKVLQKQWRTYKGNKTERVIRDEAQEKAAKTLQREWRKHLNQKDMDAQNEAITDIQAAFRGHLTRRDMLNNVDDDDLMDSDDAIVNVQSALRGHLTRTRHHEDPEDDQWSRNILRDTRNRELSDSDDHKTPEKKIKKALDTRNGELSDSEDSDDDIVVGGASRHSHQINASPRTTDRSPFSAKKRSSFTETSGKPEQGRPRPAPRTKPHPAPRTHKPAPSPTQHTSAHSSSPQTPPPRYKQPIVTVDDDDDDSDDDAVICSPTRSRKEPSKSNTATATAKAVKDELDNDVFIETESDSDNDLVVCGKPLRTEQQRSSLNDKKQTKMIKSEVDDSNKMMVKSTERKLDEKKQANQRRQHHRTSLNDKKQSQTGKSEVYDSINMTETSAKRKLNEKDQTESPTSEAVSSEEMNNKLTKNSTDEMETSRTLQLKAQSRENDLFEENSSKRDKKKQPRVLQPHLHTNEDMNNVNTSSFKPVTEKSQALQLKANTENQSVKSCEISKDDTKGIKAATTHSDRTIENAISTEREEVEQCRGNESTTNAVMCTKDFETNITENIGTPKSAGSGEVFERTQEIMLDHEKEMRTTKSNTHNRSMNPHKSDGNDLKNSQTKTGEFAKGLDINSERSKPANEISPNILTNQGVDTYMLTSPVNSGSTSTDTKSTNELSSNVQGNHDTITASSTGSIYNSSVTQIPYDKTLASNADNYPTSTAVNTFSNGLEPSSKSKSLDDNASSTSKPSSPTNASSSLTSKSSSSVSNAISSTSKASFPTSKASFPSSKTSSAAFSGENPYIGLTSGSPGMSSNRYFRGIEWGKTNSFSQLKKKQEKQTKDYSNNALKEIKIVRNSNEEQSVQDEKARDKLLGAENGSNSSALQDKRMIQNLEQQMSMPVEKPVVKSLETDSNNNENGLEYTAIVQNDTKEDSVTDQKVYDNKPLGKSHDQLENPMNKEGCPGLAQTKLKDIKPTTRSRDKYEISSREELRSHVMKTKSSASQSRSTAHAQSKKGKPIPTPRSRSKISKTEPSDQDNGLTKQINPQRTIEEAPEESDDGVMSHRSRQKPSRPSTSQHVTKSHNKPAKARQFEIVDSDDDDDIVVTPKKNATKVSRERAAKKSDSRNERNTKKNQSSSKASAKTSREVVESEDDSDDDDAVVTPSKSSRLGSKGSSSKYSKTPTPKRPSFVDSLLAPAPRSSEDNRGRRLIQDDDDDDDDDIVMSSFRKTSKKNSVPKKKDSLASLWSDSQPKKKSSFGFSSFEDSFSSKKRNTSNLDELF